MPGPPVRPTLARAGLVGALAVAALAGGAPGHAAPAKPDLVPLLQGYDRFWTSDGTGDLHGTVNDAAVLRRNDELVVWANRNATTAQRFRALQDAEYDDGDSYDQSITDADALGTVLGPLYARGRFSGRLPLTSALLNSQTGTAGAFVNTDAAKRRFSYPRPYLPVDPATPAAAGEDPECAPGRTNGSSLQAIRAGQPWADAGGRLLIRRLEPVVDRTGDYAPEDVELDPGYGDAGLCTGGSFPSGHTTTAYQAGITLATLLPELAPEILARASEQANNRLVVGVHYPLDLMGGRIDGEVAIATLWADKRFRTRTLAPARRELRRYLRKACGATIARCAARGRAYRNDPYGGRVMPGLSAQRVTGRRSALRVFRERLTYGFPRTGEAGRAPDVPATAQQLLRTTYPGLSARQRTAVLAQTQLEAGFPLDRTGTNAGSWQRLDLAAATSATVRVGRKGGVRVTATGGRARVVRR